MAEILYLDGSATRSVKKPLAKHGDVFQAGDITEALYLMAERDFDYYFIDADIREARPFIHHIRHDPQLAPPHGIVLLTDNREEDCEAWRVDTFITRERFAQDVPYVFSHLRGREEEPENVIRIGPAPAADRRDRVSERSERATARPSRTSTRPARVSRLLDQETSFGDADAAEAVSAESVPVAEAPGTTVSLQTDFSGSRSVRGPFKVAAALVLVGALAVWAFTLGPLGSQAGREDAKADKSEGVKAGSYDKPGGSRPEDSGSGMPYTTSPPAVAPPPSAAAPAPATTVMDSDGAEPAAATTPSNEVPAPTANSTPSASISGPDQLMRGESGTFCASGSDPDGDSVSLSWTSRTLCWSSPGLYSVSVTVTDSRGAVSSTSKSVRVI
ncbi:MAG: hypothetical protein KKF41_10280 [Actinobacteria bacterium]|nr:hypothetical protein [Actinomycetota bacterium]MBU1943093.1 hypothetical protein [Actinomycetota bacterium]MBU2687960.1 hypothetical protein [Actinomycetota bacterium]